jgi:hypothetical protein
MNVHLSVLVPVARRHRAPVVRGPAPGLRGSTSLPACPSDPEGSRLSTIFAQISYEMLRKPALIAR